MKHSDNQAVELKEQIHKHVLPVKLRLEALQPGFYTDKTTWKHDIEATFDLIKEMSYESYEQGRKDMAEEVLKLKTSLFIHPINTYDDEEIAIIKVEDIKSLLGLKNN